MPQRACGHVAVTLLNRLGEFVGLAQTDIANWLARHEAKCTRHAARKAVSACAVVPDPRPFLSDREAPPLKLAQIIENALTEFMRYGVNDARNESPELVERVVN